MISILLGTLFSWMSLADGCNFKLQDATQPRAYPEYHTLFLRCHPTRNIVTSNEIGSDGYTLPVAIDMESGRKERVITPAVNPVSGTIKPNKEEIELLTSGLDAVMSREKVYVNLYENNQTKLGVYQLGESNAPTLIAQVDGETDAFDYPSPVNKFGREMIMYRTSKGLYLRRVDTDHKKVTLSAGKQLCGNIIGDGTAEQPYMAGNGQYLGVAVNGEMQILELDWDHATDRAVPCKFKRKLPAGSGKPSFSEDGTRVVFHADSLDNLGKTATMTGQYNSYIMDIGTGDVMPITNVGPDHFTQFPAFCGSDRIATRVTNDATMSNSEFHIMNAPSVAQINAYAKGSCGTSPAPASGGTATQ